METSSGTPRLNSTFKHQLLARHPRRAPPRAKFPLSFRHKLDARPARVAFNLEEAVSPSSMATWAAHSEVRRYRGRIVDIAADEVHVRLGEIPSGATFDALLSRNWFDPTIPLLPHRPILVVTWLNVDETDGHHIEDAWVDPQDSEDTGG